MESTLYPPPPLPPSILHITESPIRESRDKPEKHYREPKVQRSATVTATWSGTLYRRRRSCGSFVRLSGILERSMASIVETRSFLRGKSSGDTRVKIQYCSLSCWIIEGVWSDWRQSHKCGFSRNHGNKQSTIIKENRGGQDGSLPLSISFTVMDDQLKITGYRVDQNHVISVMCQSDTGLFDSSRGLF